VKGPWSRGDLVRLAALVALGGVVCALAWNGASTRSRLADQTAWIGLGVSGFLVAAVAQFVWLVQGRRAVAAHGVEIQASVASLIPDRGAVPFRSAPTAAGFVATGGMRHFHRPDCSIAAGRGWSAEPRGVHEAAGRTPCGICTP
jgi:hypothetical protein